MKNSAVGLPNLPGERALLLISAELEGAAGNSSRISYLVSHAVKPELVGEVLVILVVIKILAL